MKTMSKKARRAYRLCFTVLASALAAEALAAPPLPAHAAQEDARETGTIERVRVVTQDREGLRLGGVQRVPGARLSDDPSEAEELWRMMQTVRGTYGEGVVFSGGRPRGRDIGVVNQVRLRCGEATYVFEEGLQRFAVGENVLTDHSLSPRLIRAPIG
jgi:hypothetical protein